MLGPVPRTVTAGSPVVSEPVASRLAVGVLVWRSPLEIEVCLTSLQSEI